MAPPGWPYPESPFHPGEIAVQARLGVADKIDQQARRMIRDFMPEQHRQFFAKLPYVIVGSLGDRQQPWASILLNKPGFLSSSDEHHLSITAQTLFGDPLAQNLGPGVDIGLLGIELPTRRRNRLNGVVTATSQDGFDLRVTQSFGNCPQYIQTRTAQWIDFDPAKPKPVQSITQLSEADRSLIQNTDTFFIATAYQGDDAGKARGVDVSHRGGKPGFVRVDSDGSLTIPDFSGNLIFNTLGNLELNPKAGLLFLDFDQGDLLYLTGTAEVIWDGPEVEAYEGAERLLRFRLTQGHRVEGSLPVPWSAPEFSPFLDKTGSWS